MKEINDVKSCYIYLTDIVELYSSNIVDLSFYEVKISTKKKYYILLVLNKRTTEYYVKKKAGSETADISSRDGNRLG